MNKALLFSISVLALTTMASAGQKSKAKIKKVVKPSVTKFALSAESQPMVGLWTLRDGDKPRLDIKMKFTPDGHFAFIGPNWRSAGNFKVVDGKLGLEWSSVDGQPVKAGLMKKEFTLDAVNSSFVIDKYTYYKFGVPVATANPK